MPLNSAGFDCRVPRIMGDWMTSIPATLAHPNNPEKVFLGQESQGVSRECQRVDPQPYVEVKPGDPMYQAALGDAM